MRRMAWAVMGWVVCAPAFAQVVWRGDQDLSAWAGRECAEKGKACADVQGKPAGRIQWVDAPEEKKEKALRFELRQGDKANGGVRNELVGVRKIGGGMTLFEEGDERVFAWSTYFPRDFPHPHPAPEISSWHVFFQLRHESHEKLWSPPLAMTLNESVRKGHLDYEIRLRSAQKGGEEPEDLWRTTIDRGKWHRFALRVKFSHDPQKGLVELWHNGERVLGPLPRATLYEDEPSYVKQGLYRDSRLPADWVEVVYQKGLVIAHRLEDVLPKREPEFDIQALIHATLIGQLPEEVRLNEG